MAKILEGTWPPSNYLPGRKEHICVCVAQKNIKYLPICKKQKISSSPFKSRTISLALEILEFSQDLGKNKTK